jgi:hypothetical protein
VPPPKKFRGRAYHTTSPWPGHSTTGIGRSGCATSTSLEGDSSTRGGRWSFRCRATGGNNVARYTTAEPSYHRTCGRTRRFPWTPHGGIFGHTSPSRGAARASSETTSTTMTCQWTHHITCHGPRRRRCRWSNTCHQGRSQDLDIGGELFFFAMPLTHSKCSYSTFSE